MLARTHEVAQLFSDRITTLLATDSSDHLNAAQRKQLLTALTCMTSALGQLTFATLSVEDFTVETHLPLLFEALDVLNSVCGDLAVPSMPWVVDLYRTRFTEIGLLRD